MEQIRNASPFKIQNGMRIESLKQLQIYNCSLQNLFKTLSMIFGQDNPIQSIQENALTRYPSPFSSSPTMSPRS